MSGGFRRPPDASLATAVQLEDTHSPTPQQIVASQCDATWPGHDCGCRLWLRGLIVVCVLGAVVGLTVANYVTDDSLRNDVYIERKTSGITPSDAQVGPR